MVHEQRVTKSEFQQNSSNFPESFVILMQMEGEKGVRKGGRYENGKLVSVLMAVVMDRCR